MSIKLSVLDQSFTRSPELAPEALKDTISMAQWCEHLGYERFWVSEHHAFSTLAGSVPEVLLAAIGTATKTIQLGSGGIMLPHYSAYKVAETFSLLANLYPGRIDLGIGRAPGADMSTAVALATDGQPKFERFPELVEKLRYYLQDDEAKPLVSPKPPKELPMWILGSSSDSAQLASERGLPYNLGLFINPQAQQELVRLYKQHFKPSQPDQRPYGVVTMSVFCCDTQEQAKEQQHTFDVNFYRFVTGQRSGPNGGALLTPEQAKNYAMTPQLEGFIAQRSQNRAVGNAEQVCSTIRDVAKRFGADEVMMVTNMFYTDDRRRSFELIKNKF